MLVGKCVVLFRSIGEEYGSSVMPMSRSYAEQTRSAVTVLTLCIEKSSQGIHSALATPRPNELIRRTKRFYKQKDLAKGMSVGLFVKGWRRFHHPRSKNLVSISEIG